MRWWWNRKTNERDLDRELQAHVELEEIENRENGGSADGARYAALRALGNTTLIKEDTRAMWGWTAVERFAQDLRYAFRTARKNPGFASIAVATFALGIGVNTAVFSIVNAVLLKKPPYVEPERLVTLHQKFPKQGDLSLNTSPAEFLDYRDRSRAFSAVAGYEDAVFDLTGDGEPTRISALRGTNTLFSTLGVSPFAGRTFTEAEDRPGGAQVVVLSHEFWQRHFGGNASAIGSTIRLNEQPYTIIGIMAAGFEFPFTPVSVGEPPALWMPMALTAKRIQDRAAEFPVHVVGRLQPGVSLAQAEQDVSRVADEFQKEHPEIYTGNLFLQVDLVLLGSAEASRARPVLLALAGAVIFVLMIACANVMNLLMARAAARQREMAVRCALGAGARRLIAQLLTEGLLLSTIGGVVGWLLAQALIRLVVTLWPSFVAGLGDVRIDPLVLTFTVGISILTGLVCGLAPALTWKSPEIGEVLKQAGRQGVSKASNRVRSVLVVFEAASAVTLLIAAGLLVHSLVEVLHVPMGFSPTDVVITRTTFNRQRYPSNEKRREAERQMAQRIAQLPGVAAAGLTTHIPLADDRQIGYLLEGEDIRSARWADNALVSGDYFAAMGIPILHGRTFGPEDTPQAPLAAIVNDSMARRSWPGGEAVGKAIFWGGRKLIVVGVAGDVHLRALDSAVNPTIYSSVYQIESGATTSAVFVVRSHAGNPAGLASAIREAIWSVDRGVPVFDMRTMDQIVARSLTARRFAAAMLSAFAGLALALAVVGLYGVLSYAVAQRTSELGLRIALGATSGEVLRLVLGNGLRLTGIGLVVGAVVGAGAARALSNLLFGVKPIDPATFAIAACALVGVALAASYIPARRAARVDPIIALRHE